jgi:hypothetical protein
MLPLSERAPNRRNRRHSATRGLEDDLEGRE